MQNSLVLFVENIGLKFDPNQVFPALPYILMIGGAKVWPTLERAFT